MSLKGLFWAGSLMLMGLVHAEDDEADSMLGGTRRQSRDDRLFDISGKVWPALGKQGIDVDVDYAGQLFWNLKGGNATNSSPVPLGAWDLSLRASSEGLGLWNGGTLKFRVLHENGRSFSERYAGTSQELSWIEDEPFGPQIYELWYRQAFADNRIWIKLGKFVTDSELANSETAETFNPEFFAALGNSPLRNAGIGALAGIRVADSVFLQGMVVNNAVDNQSFGTFGEAAWRKDSGQTWQLEACWKGELVERCETLLRLGGWYSTRYYQREEGDDEAGTSLRHWHSNYGGYLILDQGLYAGGTQENPQSLNAFTIISVVPGDRNQDPWCWCAGLMARGFVPGRPRDSQGIAFSNDYFGSGIQQSQGYHRIESVTEIFYRAEVTCWMNVKPFLQYVHQPAEAMASGNANHAVIGGIQLEMRF
jgi:porin